MFKYKNKYYVCASDLYGWNASNVYYLEATSIYGPYTPTNNMQKMPGADADYGHVTQTGFFYTVRGTEQETVIYCGDRWAGFAGNGNGFNQWCPISFVNNKPYFNSLSQWHLNAETGEWSVGSENNYVKNFSFDADRKNIPSAEKPSQAYLRGWTTEVAKGNKVSTSSADSPVLNAKNSKADRETVMGNFCMNISDKVDFQRKIYQKIASTDNVPLQNGQYTLSVYAKVGSAFNELYMYAKSGDETFRTDIADADGQWHTYTIENVIVKDNKIEIGFYADGKANAWCHIDDMKLLLTKSTDNQPDGISVVHVAGRANTVDYFLVNGQHTDRMHRGLNIVRQTDENGQVTVRKVLER